MDILEMYKWTAIISGAVFLIQLLSSLFDFHGDFDTDMDTEGLDGGDAGHGMGHVLLSFISVRNVVAFLLAFSVTGYFGIRDYGFGPLSFAPGVVAGCALVLFNMYLMRVLASLKRDTEVSEHEVEGLTGIVSFPILPARSGEGKITVTVAGKFMTLQAITDEEVRLERNTEVVVERVMDHWIALVRQKKA